MTQEPEFQRLIPPHRAASFRLRRPGENFQEWAAAAFERTYRVIRVQWSGLMYCGDRSYGAEDATSEGVAQAIQKALDMDPGGHRVLPRRGFIHVCAWRRAFDHNRTAHSRPVTSGHEGELLGKPIAKGRVSPKASDVLDQQKRRRVLVKTVATLPEDMRQIVYCRFLAAMSEEETASVLGVPKGTVKSRTHRALVRLHKLLSGTICDVEAELCATARGS
ncbi:MAG: sigma-70 family RNA polymerase sigma factor [bacterium]|nr:sigma-70 family RNA polymerase sigma factor [bacterium]